MIGMQQTLPNMKSRCVGLFSEYYVKYRFPETAEYKKLAPPSEIKETIRIILDKNIRTVTQKNEAQLEEDLIRPILNAVGIRYIVAVTVPGGQEADYAYFVDEKSRAEADAREKEKYKGAVALADAKRWGRELDKSGGTALDKNPNAIPTKQIANYIQDTGIDWGVLTDGQIWRLYNRNTPPVSQSFFEVNLPEALLDDDAFHLFYALFSGPAFAGGVQEFVRKESEDYWTGIGDDLKRKAFDALEILCNGFRDHKPDQNIYDIYEGAIIFLYRLLFVLYAEARKLLPDVRTYPYRDYSLQRLLDEVKDRGDDAYSAILPRFYGTLKILFRLIAEGDLTMGVYYYNGGLFKDEEMAFLPAGFFENNAVADRQLAAALRRIAFTDDKKTGRHQVDYGELDVRHLGSIYEGLLEFHPRLDDGEIKLYTDKGERKATGSYYTPAYIVNYIVENTLGPLTENMKAPEEVLSLKILDPAMGSGHFLVGAVDYIGRKCAALAGPEAAATEKDYERAAVEKCVFGVDLNPLAVELAKLSLWLHTVARAKPLSFLDHHFKAGNSLVGARVADLGELPMKKNKRGKNDRAPNAGRQENLFAGHLRGLMPAVLNEVMGILARGTEDLTDVEAKEALLKAAEDHLRPFKAVADTWVSTFFGNVVTPDNYNEALTNIGRPAEAAALPAAERATALSRGDAQTAGRYFFHWELEFPEVFYDEFGREKEDAGFDAVIGNPPYVDVKAEGFYTTYETAKATNLYAYFAELSLRSLRAGGYYGMIVPLSLVCSQRMNALREFVAGFAGKTKVATFAKRPAAVFPQVQQRTAIIIAENNPSTFEFYTTRYNRWYTGEELDMMARLKFIRATELINEGLWPKVGDAVGKRILTKINKKPAKLGDYLSGEVEFFYHNIGMYWLKAYYFKPVFKGPNGELRESTNLRTLKTKDKLTREIIVGLINSSLFYYFWLSYSDDFHFLVNEIENFPFSLDEDKYATVYRLITKQVRRLMRDYEKNSFIRNGTILDEKVMWQEFRPALSKPIIDEIDKLFSIIYGLTDEETQYVIHFDEGFRVHGEND